MEIILVSKENLMLISNIPKKKNQSSILNIFWNLKFVKFIY